MIRAFHNGRPEAVTHAPFEDCQAMKALPIRPVPGLFGRLCAVAALIAALSLLAPATGKARGHVRSRLAAQPDGESGAAPLR